MKRAATQLFKRQLLCPLSCPGVCPGISLGRPPGKTEDRGAKTRPLGQLKCANPRGSPSELGRFHWLNPCMEHLDVFTASWNNENNWFFPSPYIIPRVLKHLKSSFADATLVAPLWLSAPWWPLLIYDSVSFSHEVKDYFIVEPHENMFIPTIPGITLFRPDISNFKLLLLRLCFCKSNVRSLM